MIRPIRPFEDHFLGTNHEHDQHNLPSNCRRNPSISWPLWQRPFVVDASTIPDLGIDGFGVLGTDSRTWTASAGSGERKIA